MNKFKINPLVLAIAVAMPATVYAQAQEETIDEIVVSGFKASVAKSLDAKREAAGSVDAIMASDIAEFPDNNLAESLQRIPGVAISRSGGEGRNISVRGLGNNFVRVLINGMEGVSTTGGTDATGGNNRGRGFDFNTFSSDLFNSITIRKTASAEFDEGSLGATVDMKAATPPKTDGLVFTAGGKLGYNDLSKKTDPAVNFLVADSFADGKVSAVLSVAYNERNISDQGNSTVRWENLAANAFGKYQGTAITTTNAINTAFRPRLPRYDSYETDYSRLGVSGSIQFKPTDATEINLDVLTSTYDATRTEKFIEGAINNGATNKTANVTDYAIQGNSLIYAKVSGVRILAESRQDELSTDFAQYTLSGKHDFTDSFRVKAMIGTSQSDFKNPIQNTVGAYADNQDITWDYRNGAENAELTFGDAAYVPANWKIYRVQQRPQGTKNTYDTGSTGFEFDLNDALTLKGGASIKKFKMETYESRYFNEFAGVPTAAQCALKGNTNKNNTAPSDCGVDLQSNPNFLGLYDSGLDGVKPWLLPNRQLIMDTYSLYNQPMEVQRASTFNVSEDTTAEYIQLDFKTEIAGLPFRGDLGVRHFTTDQSSSTWIQTGVDAYRLAQIPYSYSDTLPSVNLVLEPIQDVQLRASYSEGIARSGLGSLAGDTQVSVSGSNYTVKTGNPYLKPTRAKSYDLGIEWYFAKESSISLALFRKELSTQVQTIVGGDTYDKLGLPLDAIKNACGLNYSVDGACGDKTVWSTSKPVNAPGGPLNGFEISYQQPFTFLPGVLSNFGFIGSYTHVKAEMDFLDANNKVIKTASLIGLSPSTSAATIYYEKDAFKARISVAKRDGYLTTATADANGNDQNGTYGTTNVDAAASYQLNENFKLTLDLLNLTKEADNQWVDAADLRDSYYHETGRQIVLGANYKF